MSCQGLRFERGAPITLFAFNEACGGAPYTMHHGWTVSARLDFDEQLNPTS